MNTDLLKSITSFIRSLYPGMETVPLHAPVFFGKEKEYLAECIDTTYVSYVGSYVNRFEEMISTYTGAKYAIATVNGTCALQTALLIAGIKPGDFVITQALTFVATANAIHFANATPVFIDSDPQDLGMDISKLEEFLSQECRMNEDGFCYHKVTNRRISACVPVHIFGHPVKIDKVVEICEKYNITVIEDAAESLGSTYKGKHTGTFGLLGILSFNGNKTVTTGGGGMILTNDKDLATRARHITTTAKMPHPYEFIHNEPAFNYRMTNLSAAIGVAQMENFDFIIRNKRETAARYNEFFTNLGMDFFTEKENSFSNYWLNVLLMKDRNERNDLLELTNASGITTRPAWRLMTDLPMYSGNIHTDLSNAVKLENTIVNLPSSIRK
ncbi:MAG: LegC family aminotransferase [Bacteroidales bacterium]